MRARSTLQWHFLTGHHPLRFKGLWVPLWRPPGSWRTDWWWRNSTSRSADMRLRQSSKLKTKNKSYQGHWCYHDPQVSHKGIMLTLQGKTRGRDTQKVKARTNSRPLFDVQNKTISFMRLGRRGSRRGYSTKLYFRCHARWAWAKDVVLMVCREREQAETAEGYNNRV